MPTHIDTLRDGVPQPSAPASLRDGAIGVLGFAAVLALLYAGRAVLIPVTLALMLGLLLAPWVRGLQRLGLRHTLSVITAVLALVLLVGAAAGVLSSQLLRIGAGVPQYEKALQQKLRTLDDMTVGRLAALTSAADRLTQAGTSGPPPFLALAPGDRGAGSAPLAVELTPARTAPLQLLSKLLSAIWLPLESTGIVLVVLIFALLEQEGLRDRFIRAVGGSNIRLTTLALNDAAARLSRFFGFQLAVNLGVGATLAVGLGVLRVPEALLWGALAALLRFIPYIGVWLAALLATVLAAAVAPGWALALSTLALFVAVELIAGQIVEPNLYGHTTGLSPLSVVIAAIFWSALWGPVGLVLSTPLTLCLLVLGRHIRALSFLELLLGDVQALSLPQKFYQRALSGDASEILAIARAFLKHHSFAAYCDRVLMPALHLAFLDLEAGAITQEQQTRFRSLLVAVVSALAGESRALRRNRLSLLDDQNPGLILRHYREELIGRWQGPLNVDPGTIALCLGVGNRVDTLAAELLVRALREDGVDARHVSLSDLASDSRPRDADPAAVALVFLVSALPGEERAPAQAQLELLRRELPKAVVVAVLLPGMSVAPEAPPSVSQAESVSSFVEAVQLCEGELKRRKG